MIASDQDRSRFTLAIIVAPSQHSAIGCEIIRCNFDGMCNIGKRRRFVAEPEKGVATQHEAMGAGQRWDSASAVRQSERRRKIAGCQGLHAPQLERLVMRLLKDCKVSRHLMRTTLTNVRSSMTRPTDLDCETLARGPNFRQASSAMGRLALSSLKARRSDEIRPKVRGPLVRPGRSACP